MKKFTKLTAVLLVLLFALGITAGCSKQSTPGADKPLKVGVTAGPHAEVMDVVKKVAEKDGLKIEVIEFNDYIQPNVALFQGDIDANSFQHQPYLDNIIQDRNYDIVSVAKTVIFPMGIYSKKIKSLNEIQAGAVVAIPNDPTNGGRALLLLEKLGLIKLKPNVGISAAVTDIAENPKNLKIKELEAAQIPRSLDDIDFAAINTNYAMTAGLIPNKDAIALEDLNSPYANLIAVKAANKDNPAVQKLVKAYQSDEVKKFIQEHFKGSVSPAW
ncbi:MAG: MetQ/NlpA family ABC transporter substrate-binding protein [Veillonellaceae bacterium]|jgi:D-methionine transport system substrate-binding protein|nr:MetQ/NlpA family ABC transporter substrate-binding protein [Veillonellaceae bacterium]